MVLLMMQQGFEELPVCEVLPRMHYYRYYWIVIFYNVMLLLLLLLPPHISAPDLCAPRVCVLCSGKLIAGHEHDVTHTHTDGVFDALP